jgi:uncharacterized protein YciI
MKVMVPMLLATVLLGASPPPATQTAPAHPPVQMVTYYMGFLKKGPTWTPAETPEIKALQDAHLANIRKLAATGELLLAGPFTDGGDLRGLFLFQVDSLEKAKALCDTDPMVQAGRLVVDLHPWMGPKGIRYDGQQKAGGN